MNDKREKEYEEIDFSAYAHLPRIVGRGPQFTDETTWDGFASDVFTCIAFSGAEMTLEQRWEVVEALRNDPRPVKLTVSAELIRRGLFPNDRRPFWMPDEVGPKEWEATRQRYER